MKTKVTVLITVIIGFIVAITSCFIVIAATDAPHNASNNISCGSCHGETIMNSPFWGTGTYDQLCLSCHRRSTGYSQTDAPAEKTHSDSSGSALTECRDCHNPHYQRQKVFKNTDASNLYLATGKITNCVYNGDNTSTLTYSTITYKSGWDATKLIKKTEDYRGAILFPNVNKLGYNYPITAVNPTAKTITVNGNLTTECNNNLFSSATFAAMYGQYIKDNIVVDGTNKQVKFFDKEGTKSFADGDAIYDGICEVCHTQTKYYRNNGSGNTHYKEEKCSKCHSHPDGLSHEKAEGTGCDSCHGKDTDNGGSGTTISHSTHTENDPDDLKGPFKTCSDCHDTNIFPYFKSGVDSNGDGKYNPSETDVCNDCHSPNGPFNGVTSVGASVGVKTNWVNGVYQTDGTLIPGKEKWCAGCHDNVPAVVNGKTATDIIGDNNTYGYYLDAHGSETYGVKRQGVYVRGECLHCHDVSQSGHGGLLFADLNPGSQTDNFCFQCHKGSGSVQGGGITNYTYSKNFGGGTQTFTTIYDAFNPTTGATPSSHNLSDVLNHAISSNIGFTNNTSSCVVCHDPHFAQRNYPVTLSGKGGVRTAIRRAVDYASNPTNLWGDEDAVSGRDERMKDYTNNYKSPYYVDPANTTRIINESFEGPDYEETWAETLNGGTLNSDFPISSLPGIPPPGADSQCLQSISTSSGYKAFATQNYGSEQPSTFTRFYLYVKAEDLNDGDTKPIGALRNSANDNVIIFGLNQNSGQLRFLFRLFYNNGNSYNNYFANISTGIWYRIEVKYNTTNPDAADAWEWRVDGASKNSGKLTDLTAYYSGIQKWNFGFLGDQAETGTICFDLVAVRNDDWVGEEQRKYEPANNSTADGSNLPNFVNYCTTQCHARADVYSTKYGRNLRQIDWGTSGDIHGKRKNDAASMGYTVAPYGNEDYNYVLSCMDCHEPHGSQNEWLLRTTVNGKDNISVTFAGGWWQFCTACHVLTNGTSMYHRERPPDYDPKCPTCHFHGYLFF